MSNSPPIVTFTGPPDQAYPTAWPILIRDFWPPGPNRTSGQHWSKRKALKRQIMEKLLVACGGSAGIRRFAGPCRVSIYRLWGKGQRALDYDNLVASVKPLVDCLRREKVKVSTHSKVTSEGGLGIIEDDDPDKLKLVVAQQRGGTAKLYETLARFDLLPPSEAPWPESTLIIVEGRLEADAAPRSPTNGRVPLTPRAIKELKSTYRATRLCKTMPPGHLAAFETAARILLEHQAAGTWDPVLNVLVGSLASWPDRFTHPVIALQQHLEELLEHPVKLDD